MNCGAALLLVLLIDLGVVLVGMSIGWLQADQHRHIHRS